MSHGSASPRSSDILVQASLGTLRRQQGSLRFEMLYRLPAYEVDELIAWTGRRSR